MPELLQAFLSGDSHRYPVAAGIGESVGPHAAGPERASPFAETQGWIAGYDIIKCADLDEAVEVASKHPMAKFGKIEIRPVWPFGE
jgi:hypothetical protein